MPKQLRSVNVKFTGRAVCLTCNKEFMGSIRVRDKLVELHNRCVHKGEHVIVQTTTIYTRGSSNNNNPNLVHEPLMNAHEHLNQTALEFKQ